MVTAQQKKHIVKLLKKDMPIKEIRARVGVDYWAVYRLMKQNDIPKNKVDVDVKDNFVCPGFNHCVTCKRVFEYPCQMSP